MTDETTFGGCQGCSRRDFLERAALMAAALIAAGCGVAGDITGINGNPLPGGSLAVKLTDYAGLATVGQPVEIHNSDGSASNIAVVRTGTTTFIALYMACTHQGSKVNIQGQSFYCPNHGARFSSSGAVTMGPATRSLTQVSVAFDATAGTITLS